MNKQRPFIDSIFWGIILMMVLISKPKDESVNIIFSETRVVPTFIYVDYIEEPDPESPIPMIFEIETLKTPEPIYGFTDEEIYLMTVLLSGSKDVDGDGEYDVDYGNRDNLQQISLVLSVVMNRINSVHFPDTVEEVIWQRNQFSPMTRWTHRLPEVSDISYLIVKEWCENYDLHGADFLSIPDNHLYFWGNGKVNKSRERWYN